MKNKSLFLLGLLPLIISSCQAGQQDNKHTYSFSQLTEEEIVEHIATNDKYRNMYQIFPISFSDSNGDGKGDLQGIIDKLDYLHDLHYTGIWLNPIHPSSTAHHFDVENYMDIGSDFGTLEIFDNLVTACHERNMTIIIDLVINHTSNKHPWFEDSYICAKSNKTNNPMYKLYNWIECTDEKIPDGYRKVNPNDKVAYEGRFDTSMPDLNLQQVLDDNNGDLATKLKDIFSFWLVDHHIDGFRLDAVTQYFTGDQNKNLAFMTWMNSAIRAIKQDAYVVGEGSWSTNSTENKAYQASGLDSFFQFGNCAKNTGYVAQAVVQQNAKVMYNGLVNNAENADGGIEAPFLSNHDVPRYIGAVQGRKTLANAKFAMGLLQTLKGATFTYYGDEVGMASQSTLSDSYYRLPIRWGEEDKHTTQINKIKLYSLTESMVDEEMSYPYPDVATQLADENSLVNYVKQANLLRIKYPQLARGDAELTLCEENPLAIIKRTFNNESIYVVINASLAQTYDVDYSEFATKVSDALLAQGELEYISDTAVRVSARSIVILQ